MQRRMSSSTFASLSLSASLQEVVAEIGYAAPTPIQEQGIPLLLAGRDLIAQSKTGSGKTAAFALPILQALEVDKRSLQALVVCPTRELAAQVAREIRKLGRKHKGLAVLEVVGGQPVRGQLDALERGVHVVVGTPGRLLDHLNRGSLHCEVLTTVVLDEADRMLDMGFGADVESILSGLPKERQTALFSATFPSTIESMSRRYQRNAERITVVDPDEDAALQQFYVECDKDEKLETLYWVMNKYPHESALLFCNFKSSVSELQQELANAGFSVDRLDGDLEQFQRDQVLAKFRNQSVRILIATDVAGRGIDVEDLELVVNFELPPKPNIYVHRIGRTARAGKAGVAVSLVSGRERSEVQAIEAATGETVAEVQRGAVSAVDVRALAREAEMQTILISGGRKDKVRPGDILGALTGEAGGLRGEDIGKIEIQDRLSYVAVKRAVGKRAASGLNGGRIKGKRYRATLLN
jgi:ATP-independent RNA helicase DbpA